MTNEQKFGELLAKKLSDIEYRPDEALWQRIDQQVHKKVLWPWLATAASIALVAVVWWPLKPPAVVQSPAVSYELAAQDRQLQQAYLYADSDAEVTQQWQKRQQIIKEMAKRP